MGRSEFVGQNNQDWDDDPDRFEPRVILRQPRTPAMSIRVEGKVARLVTKNPVTELTLEDVEDMLISLQDARDFLELQ